MLVRCESSLRSNLRLRNESGSPYSKGANLRETFWPKSSCRSSGTTARHSVPPQYLWHGMGKPVGALALGQSDRSPSEPIAPLASPVCGDRWKPPCTFLAAVEHVQAMDMLSHVKAGIGGGADCQKDGDQKIGVAPDTLTIRLRLGVLDPELRLPKNLASF